MMATPHGRLAGPASIHARGNSEALLGQIAVGLMIGFGAVGFVVWAGAQLAATAFGDGPLPVGIAAGGHAALGLLAHVDDPGLAWSQVVRRRLPEPLAYWACTTLVAAVAVAVAVLVLWAWTRRSNHSGHVLGVKPHAGFARPADLKTLLVDGPLPGRLTLGHVGRRLVAAEPQASLAVVGPTGCGKTIGFAIPALLEWRGPIIATSVKNDLLDATVAHRARRGAVWIYDPTATSGHIAARWSPLAACATWTGAMRVASWLCDAAQPRADTVNDGDYWYTQARKALAPYLHAAAVGDKTMRDVIRWIDTQEQDEITDILHKSGGVEQLVEQLLATDRATERRRRLESEITAAEIVGVREHLAAIGGGGPQSWEMQRVGAWPVEQQTQLRERVAKAIDRRLVAEFADEAISAVRSAGGLDALIAAQALWNKEQRLRGSVFATVENVLSGYADPGVGKAADGNDIDLGKWLQGDNTIFVVAAAHEQARLRPVLTVLIQQAIRTAYETANANQGALSHPCLILLDEAGNIAPLRDLPGYASTARSHGITLVSIWQDLAQIKATFGDRAQTVLNNHRAKLFGSGIADEATLEYVSRLIGDERRTEVNLSGDLHGPRRSASEHANYRRAAPIDLLRRIKPNEAVLVYGNELPAHVRLRPRYGSTTAAPGLR